MFQSPSYTAPATTTMAGPAWSVCARCVAWPQTIHTLPYTHYHTNATMHTFIPTTILIAILIAMHLSIHLSILTTILTTILIAIRIVNSLP